MDRFHSYCKRCGWSVIERKTHLSCPKCLGGVECIRLKDPEPELNSSNTYKSNTTSGYSSSSTTYSSSYNGSGDSIKVFLVLIAAVIGITAIMMPGGMICMLLSNFVDFYLGWFWITCIIFNLIIFGLCKWNWKAYLAIDIFVIIIVSILCGIITDFKPWSYMAYNLFHLD